MAREGRTLTVPHRRNIRHQRPERMRHPGRFQAFLDRIAQRDGVTPEEVRQQIRWLGPWTCPEIEARPEPGTIVLVGEGTYVGRNRTRVGFLRADAEFIANGFFAGATAAFKLEGPSFTPDLYPVTEGTGTVVGNIRENRLVIEGALAHVPRHRVLWTCPTDQITIRLVE